MGSTCCCCNSSIIWATCCNCFCLNGQPEEIQHRPQQGTRAQAYANAGYSSFPLPTGPEQGCQGGGARFSNASLKHICQGCKKTFCLDCLHQPESGPYLYHLCECFRATAFQRDYVELQEISTEMCYEKVELIIGQPSVGCKHRAAKKQQS